MKKIVCFAFFSLFLIFCLFFSYSSKAEEDAVLVSSDQDLSSSTPKPYKSIIPWRKGIYVPGNVDDYNPEMDSSFSQEIVEGIRGNRKNEKSASEGFYRNEDTSFDKGSSSPTSSGS